MNEILEQKIVSINSLENCKYPNIRIIWNDKIENYSAERIKEIKSYVSKKYNTEKVNVIFKPTNTIKYVNVDNDDIESIGSPEVQKKLFKEWMEENDIDIKLDDLLRLDKKVEDSITDKQDTKFCKWSIKKLKFENFLSYGDETIIDFEKLNGITLVQGTNQAGKTSILELLLFLFFNTTTKTKTADDILNIYTTKDYATVEGELIIDGITYIINRTVKRKWKKDRSSYTTSTELNFYKLLPDGNKEDLNGEQRQATDKIISESIGTIDDFLMTIVSTGDNLFDILKAKPTERGQILMKFLGLEIFEKKQEIGNDFYKEWKGKSKLNQYDETTLKDEIEGLKKEIELKTDNNEGYKLQLSQLKEEIEKYNKIKETLYSVLNKEVENRFINVNETQIMNSIDSLNKEKQLRLIEIKRIGDLIKNSNVNFDDNQYNTLVKEERNINQDIILLQSETSKLIKLNEQLKNSEFCPTCKQALKDVDHTNEINENVKKIENNNVKLVGLNDNHSKIKISISELEELRTKSIELDRNKLKKEKFELEVESYDLKIEKEAKSLEEYKNNVEILKKNKEIEEQIRENSIVLSSLSVKERDNIRAIQTIDNEIGNFNKQIVEKTELIKTLKTEQYVQKVFTSYLQMVGKNGVSKTILKHSIPTINSELIRLLSDVCDFGINLDINIKNNEVEFWMFNNEKEIRKPLMSGSGYERTVACMALRTVLNKVNHLPKASLMIYDECTEKVADENLENIKLFLDKIKSMFDHVFIVAHKELIKEWADNVILVEKINNISKLTIS